MKNVKAYVRTTLTAGLILAAAVLGGCSKSAAGSSAADTADASSGTESAASADASNSNKKELKYGKAAGVSAKDMEKERGKLREKMSKVDKNLSAKNAAPKKSQKQLTAKDLHIGDSIKVLSLNLKGTVSTLPDAKGNLFVQMGILRSQVNIRDLEKLDDTVLTGGNFSKTGSGKIKISKSTSVSTEINLLGKTVDEAVAELDKYLDDASLAHLTSVRVVHGKGTGALRKGIHEYLRRQKHVKSYRLAEFGEGDAGVTIVELG